MDIYDRLPINKTAALVTSQSGCATDDTLSPSQRHENLVARIKQIDMLIANSPKKSQERINLGLEKFNLCSEVKEVKASIKGSKRVYLSDYIIQLAKNELSSFQWNRIVKRAEKMLADNINN